MKHNALLHADALWWHTTCTGGWIAEPASTTNTLTGRAIHVIQTDPIILTRRARVTTTVNIGFGTIDQRVIAANVLSTTAEFTPTTRAIGIGEARRVDGTAGAVPPTIHIAFRTVAHVIIAARRYGAYAILTGLSVAVTRQ